jgi:hypothetical protein
MFFVMKENKLIKDSVYIHSFIFLKNPFKIINKSLENILVKI